MAIRLVLLLLRRSKHRGRRVEDRPQSSNFSQFGFASFQKLSESILMLFRYLHDSNGIAKVSVRIVYALSPPLSDQALMWIVSGTPSLLSAQPAGLTRSSLLVTVCYQKKSAKSATVELLYPMSRD